MIMRVAIRVDAAATMGTGHLRRCLSLAQALLDRGCEIWLVCRPLDAVADLILREVSCHVLWLPLPGVRVSQSFSHASPRPPYHEWAQVSGSRDASEVADCLRGVKPDWVVVDHYAFDASWHASIRAALDCRIAVIDDLGDRLLDADLLLDQNWSEDHRAKYAGFLAPDVPLLGGPHFALVSPVYRQAPRYHFNSKVSSIGIFMGGTDPSGVTAQVLDVCRRAVRFKGTIEVVSTSANPHLAALRRTCSCWPGTLLTLDEPNLAAFFARHDLQIGAGGGATWERCSIGVPTVALVVAENQAGVIPALEKLGVVEMAMLISADPRNPASLPEAPVSRPLDQTLRHLLEAPDVRFKLAQAAAKLVDGRGAERVALRLLCDTLQLRPATMGDGPLLYEWRNHPSVRLVSIQTAEIDDGAHERWMTAVLADPVRHLLVAEIGRQPVGCIRFDGTEKNAAEVSLYLDPGLQGFGLGPKLLRAGECFISDRLAHPFTITAKIVSGNAASQQLFVGCGYRGSALRYEKTVL